MTSTLQKPAFPIFRAKHPQASSMLAAWLFYEGMGNRVNEVLQGQNNFTWSAANPTWSAGLNGTCLQIAGTGLATAPTNPFTLPGVFHATAVVGFSLTTTPLSADYLVLQSQSAGFYINTSSTAGKISASFCGNSINPSGTYNDGQIHQLIMGGLSTSAPAWIDGVFLGAGGSGSSPTGIGTIKINNSGSARGLLHYLYFYNAVFTQQDVSILLEDPYQDFRGGIEAANIGFYSRIDPLYLSGGTLPARLGGGNVIDEQYGGTGNKSYALGDLLSGSTSATLAKTALGATGEILQADTTKPGGLKWSAVAAHGIVTAMGTGTLSSGAATVNTSLVTANSLVMIQDQGGGVLANIGSLYEVKASRVAGTSFAVASTNALDTSNFGWAITEPI